MRRIFIWIVLLGLLAATWYVLRKDNRFRVFREDNIGGPSEAGRVLGTIMGNKSDGSSWLGDTSNDASDTGTWKDDLKAVVNKPAEIVSQKFSDIAGELQEGLKEKAREKAAEVLGISTSTACLQPAQ